MSEKPDDLCPQPETPPPQSTRSFAPPIYPASVYACDNTAQAEALLGGAGQGYVYQRDGHPNADMLADKCRRLHGAQRAAVTSSGMAAVAAVLLSQTRAGDHLVVSNQLYGRTLEVLTSETQRLGIEHTVVDTCDVGATSAALRDNTRLVVAETISNPLLRVADIGALATAAHARGALLVIDNTFATPAVCRPLELGADLVVESVSKIMNGHSDVMLGLVCGGEAVWQRVPLAVSAWGLASSPFDCWLASRGLATLHLRIERACANAQLAAEMLAEHPRVERVEFPGLTSHRDHQLANRQFDGRHGWMVTFHLSGGRAAADAFLLGAGRIPFCPSLGELSTTLSHPQSTSHRGLTDGEREGLGIHGGTIRLSIGTESPEYVLQAIREGLGDR
ncbi:MAG: aminotransferase class I/II-fold pyridoxal phosphate-dependent enzyme [Pirellulaceae bacterium]